MENAVLVAAIIALWRMLEYLIKRGKSNEEAGLMGMVREIHRIVTAETSSGAKKVWTPSEPIEDLRRAVERIDVRQLERTHHNTTLIHDQIGEVIHTLIDLKKKLE